jgi:O-antigen/teichoic acid export membrane protein
MTIGVLFALNAFLNLCLMLALARAMAPAAYGELAVWMAAGMFAMIGAFGWLNASTLRFYTPRARESEPGVRATLDLGFGLFCVPMVAAMVGASALVAGGSMKLGLMAACLALAYGAFEYLATLARNRGAAGVFRRLMLLRHGPAFAIAVPAAASGVSVETILLLLSAVCWPAIAYGVVALRDPGASLREATRQRLVRYLRYGAPLIVAEAFYQSITLINRAWLAGSQGYEAAGAYALTFDLAFRLLAVMASVGEVVLFPRLVARHEESEGAETGARLARTLTQMLMVLVPAAIGFFAVSRPFAGIMLAPAFREAFVTLSPFAVAAAALYVCQTYALRPALQIGEKTAPFMVAAGLALAVNVALVLGSGGAMGAVSAAHAAGLAAGFVLVVVAVARAGTLAPAWRDIAVIAVGSAGVAALALPLSGLANPFLALGAAMLAAGGAYGALMLAFDVGDVRAALRRRGG